MIQRMYQVLRRRGAVHGRGRNYKSFLYNGYGWIHLYRGAFVEAVTWDTRASLQCVRGRIEKRYYA